MTFQSSYEADRLCNARGEDQGLSRQKVSILYEADRLCNLTSAPRQRGRWCRFNPLRGRQTLQLARTTGGSPRPPCFNPLRGRQTLRRPYHGQSGGASLVSILYEADRLCDGQGVPPGVLDREVSILYEADRLCNGDRQKGSRSRLPGVSILYEADRLCNEGQEEGPHGKSRFNPLRGRQTLQPTAFRTREAAPTVFQSSTRQTDFATPGRRAWTPRPSGFQSSTRQTDFATPPP